jgi:glycosyltransferase involved in cell wall biosynthesis
LVAAEALSAGLPVIASSASGVARFLGAEGTGLLVQEDTNSAWTKVLIDACGLRNAQRLREGATSVAAAQFPSWEEALRQDFVPVWQKAVGERH